MQTITCREGYDAIFLIANQLFNNFPGAVAVEDKTVNALQVAPLNQAIIMVLPCRTELTAAQMMHDRDNIKINLPLEPPIEAK
jgi:hypothetical protein